METHLSYPLLGFYRSQHVGQNWLAALTAMVDVAAFVKAVDPDVDAAEVTFAIGRHALSDIALQHGVSPRGCTRLSDEDFDELYDNVESAIAQPVDREEARRKLRTLRELYEPNADALAAWLALELPPWLPADREEKPLVRLPGIGVGGDRRDLVG
jgi:hypothetical protein